jgi:acyl-CoA reductase-like NAD-dependent aldehyde dehydrogenase
MPSSINPATGEVIAQYDYLDDAGIDAALRRAHAAAPAWAHTPVGERATLLRAIAAQLRRELPDLARSIVREMGKPLAEAQAEIEKSAWNCEFLAERAPEWLADEPVVTQAAQSWISFRPLGTMLAILPWNFPVWQIFRCAAGALIAGNTVLLKHAPNVLGCAEQVTTLLQRAGLPSGVFEHLNVPVSAIARIIADPRVAAVTLTGSPAAGAAVAAQAGAACKKSILELGGSDAFLVLDDADLESTVAAAVRARFANCGQVCIAAKRFIVTPRVAKEFEERFAAAAARLRVGDPMDSTTQLGPLAREDLRTAIETQIAKSVALGARVLTGGRRLPGPGYFHEPTVLTNISANMPVVEQETFGPVAAILHADNEAEAVKLANQSRYGLSAMVWTRDPDRARTLASQLEVGSVFINGVTASDPRLPVGGVKLSGYGRELGQAGIRELVNVQTVWVGRPA